MKINYMQIIRGALLLLICATIVFIFVQSALPQEKSKEESDKVGDILAEVIPPETAVGGYVQDNVRKIAHFVEFAFLGLWTSLYMIFKYPRPAFFLLTAPAALILAVFDETVQIFSERGPSLTDVWIDFAGFLFASIIIYTVYGIILFISKKRKQNLT